MATSSHSFLISNLEQSQFNEKACFFFKMWRRQMKAGDFDFPEFKPFSPELIVLGKPNISNPMSNLIFSGTETIGARMFGANLEKTSAKVYASQNKNCLKNYSEVVSRAQNESFEHREPVYDYISSEIKGQILAYERLLLPLKTKGGPVFLLGYSMPISVPSL